MMTRSPDILFTAEYIKNVLYFVTVRQGKELKNDSGTHFFSIDDELIYENYYSDFGPLNLGCVYKYCNKLNDKFKQYLNKQVIVHYTSIDQKKKTNAAFLMGCYGVLYLSLSPKDALKPLLVHGQNYRPFQDAVQGESSYTISLVDCLQAIQKARELGLFNFQDFDYEEYDRLDKVQGGDLNWIVPGKFLAFTGPVDYSMSLYHPPEMYINYFLENNVKIVIRLNKGLYDGNVFRKDGIAHYDLYFPDGSCPTRNILFKFLQICENHDCAVAVHCKAGLGRTGSLIGCYLIKHYHMTSHEAIGWLRICRPGSVIGHQQDWLEKYEPWLLKQGSLFRKRNYQDAEKFPTHEFGLYSFAEKTMRHRSVVFHKSRSPPPPMQRQTRLDNTSPARPQASKVREAVNKAIEKNTYDWRVKTQKVVNNQKVYNERDQMETNLSRGSIAAGEPRMAHQTRRVSPTTKQRISVKSNNTNTSTVKNLDSHQPITTYRPTPNPGIRNVHDARNFLMRSTIINADGAEKRLNSSVIVTPNYTVHSPNYKSSTPGIIRTAALNTGVGCPTPRRRLGRSPSPSPQRVVSEKTRATNTPTNEMFLVKNPSKTVLMKTLSKFMLANPRAGGSGSAGTGSVVAPSVGVASLGAASLGAESLNARRHATIQKRMISVRSDERPIATQGDLLNSIKFQRRYRDSISIRTNKFNDRVQDDYSDPRDNVPVVKKVVAPLRIASPIRRRSGQINTFL